MARSVRPRFSGRSMATTAVGVAILAGLMGCTAPSTEPSASPTPSPAAIPASALGPALALYYQGQYPQAADWLKQYLGTHAQDGAARLLLDDATADQQHKGTVKVAFMVSSGTLKGDEELRSALVAQQDVNAHGGVGGAALNLIPGGPGDIYHMPADVVGAIADDAMTGDALGSGIPFISLAPQDPDSKVTSFTPAPMQQWRATTALLYHDKVKGTVLVLLQKGQQPPADIDWARDNFSIDMRAASKAQDAGKYAAIIVITPWSGASAALGMLTHTAGKPIWICDLLGQVPSSGDSTAATPAPPTNPSAGLPDGVMVASEFGAHERDPEQSKFAQDYIQAYDHKHPGPWGWRAWHAIWVMKDLATKTPTRDGVRAGLQQLPPPGPPEHWYLLKCQAGSWQYVRTYELPAH